MIPHQQGLGENLPLIILGLSLFLGVALLSSPAAPAAANSILVLEDFRSKDEQGFPTGIINRSVSNDTYTAAKGSALSGGAAFSRHFQVTTGKAFGSQPIFLKTRWLASFAVKNAPPSSPWMV